MRPPAEDRDPCALQLPDHQFRVVAGHARMGEAGQIGIVDRDAVDGVGQVPQSRPQDEPERHRLRPRAGLDQIDKGGVVGHRITS